MKNLKHGSVFPVEIGKVVGYDGQRVTVASWRPDQPHHALVRLPSGKFERVSLGALTDPPPLDPEVQQAVDEAVAGGWFSDPRRVLFGEGE